MPELSEDTKPLVLVTGASGFLATWICRQLLERGFRVRGTVRSDEKGQYLQDLYRQQGLETDFTWVVVKDIVEPGCFDKAAKGVDGIIHTASPFPMSIDDPQKDLIEPARVGTLNALEAALAEPQVKRVVITSSFAAIGQPHDYPYTYTDQDWNHAAVEAVEKDSKNVPAPTAYRASKMIAEKAAWDYLESEKFNGSFDIVTVLPPLIFGPLLQDVKDRKSLNTSTQIFYGFLSGEGKSDQDALAGAGSYVDVRDAAKCHIGSLVTEKAGGKRMLLAAGLYYPQLFLDALHHGDCEDVKLAFPNMLRGVPGAEAPKQNTVDSSNARNILGWIPLSTSDTALGLAKSLVDLQARWSK